MGRKGKNRTMRVVGAASRDHWEEKESADRIQWIEEHCDLMQIQKPYTIQQYDLTLKRDWEKVRSEWHNGNGKVEKIFLLPRRWKRKEDGRLASLASGSEPSLLKNGWKVEYFDAGLELPANVDVQAEPDSRRFLSCEESQNSGRLAPEHSPTQHIEITNNMDEEDHVVVNDEKDPSRTHSEWQPVQRKGKISKLVENYCDPVRDESASQAPTCQRIENEDHPGKDTMVKDKKVCDSEQICMQQARAEATQTRAEVTQTKADGSRDDHLRRVKLCINGTQDIRRVRFPCAEFSSFERELRLYLTAVHLIPEKCQHTAVVDLHYFDEENDRIRVHGDDDLRAALEYMPDCLRLTVTIVLTTDSNSFYAQATEIAQASGKTVSREADKARPTMTQPPKYHAPSSKVVRELLQDEARQVRSSGQPDNQEKLDTQETGSHCQKPAKGHVISLENSISCIPTAERTKQVETTSMGESSIGDSMPALLPVTQSLIQKLKFNGPVQQKVNIAHTSEPSKTQANPSVQQCQSPSSKEIPKKEGCENHPEPPEFTILQDMGFDTDVCHKFLTRKISLAEFLEQELSLREREHQNSARPAYRLPFTSMPSVKK